MKKTLKILSIIFLSIILLVGCFFIYAFIVTSGEKLDKDKLINFESGIIYYDVNNNKINESVNNNTISKIEDIPTHVKNAFIAIEDKRFYLHNGIDVKGIIRATFNNIKSFSFKEGASTITQQLIKNTHLTSEKTINRKLIEFKLALSLEKQYSKDEILESYLNTIYFGHNCYGITKASSFYFNKEPKDLTVNEGAILAGIIKAPSNYSPIKDYNKCFERKKLVLTEMYNQNYLSKVEYEQNFNKKIELNTLDKSIEYSYSYLIENELNDIISRYPISPYSKIHVYTYFDEYAQNCLTENFNLYEDANKSGILLDKYNHVIAYLSNIGEVKRNLGSVIKPLVVYAPAIQEKVVYSCSKIIDEPIDFSGYSPKNYNDKYYGAVSVKESLEKSLNSCAVKLMNYTGIDKCLNYAKKLGLNVSNEDNNLSLALGALTNGDTLMNLTSSYGVFLNNGTYIKPNVISKIVVKNNVIYKSQPNETKVFDSQTAYIMNDMLNGVVNNGTGKKLSYLNFPMYAKTGTCGSSGGNTDAYCIAYNKDFLFGAWYGEKNDILDNSITGGNYPAIYARDVFNNLSKKFEFSDFDENTSVLKIDIDKFCYEDENEVLLYDESISGTEKITEIFRNDYYPKEKSKLNIKLNVEEPKILVNSSGIDISLCLTEYQNLLIYRCYNKDMELVIDTKELNDRSYYLDTNILDEVEYEYFYIPYLEYKNNKIFGEKKSIGKIKKSSSKEFDDDWWTNQL